MAAIDQYKQIQDNLTVQKQARDMGYTVDRANKTIWVDPFKPITEEQKTELTAKGWKVIDQQPAPTTTPLPQPVVPTAPTTPTAPTAPAPVEKQVEWTQIKTQTTPTATVEKDILSPNVTGMWTLTPEQQKLQTNELNKLNSNLSLYSTGKSLYDGVQGGSILPWTKEFTDLTTRNPRVLEEYNLIKADKEKTNTIKTLGQAIVGDTIITHPSNALEQLVGFFTKSMDTDVAWEYQNTVINNPAYQSSIQVLNGINQQIADNNNNITKLREDVRKKYSAWTPESLIASAIAREARPLIEQGQYLSQLQQNAQAEMTRIFEENKQVFDLKQEERKQKNDRMIELYGTLRQEEIRQEDFARADKKLADEIARTDKADKAKVAQLEQERLDNVKEAIAKLGVTPVGETYDELLGEYADAVKNQPKESKLISTDKPIYDPATGKWTMPPWAEPTRQAPAPSRTPTIQSSFTPDWTFQVDIANGATPRKSSRGYYECAMLVNDTLGTAMPDLHQDKLKYINSDVPVVGGAFIEKTNDKYGHTGIIESINADWTLNIVETNYPLGSGVRRTTIDPSKRNIVGYYDPQTAGQTGYRDITDITLPEKTTEFKSKSFWYGIRMDNSDKILQNVDKRFMESSTTWEYLTPRWDYVPNWLKWTEQQQYEQAQRDFINAKLRQESGAVISPQEFDNARKQYFPQPWDTNEVIQQKAKNRQLVIEEMFRNSGKTENWEDISKIYSQIRNQRQQSSWTQSEVYTPAEEKMIRELKAAGATDDEIDQALNQLRS